MAVMAGWIENHLPGMWSISPQVALWGGVGDETCYKIVLPKRTLMQWKEKSDRFESRINLRMLISTVRIKTHSLQVAEWIRDSSILSGTC